MFVLSLVLLCLYCQHVYIRVILYQYYSWCRHWDWGNHKCQRSKAEGYGKYAIPARTKLNKTWIVWCLCCTQYFYNSLTNHLFNMSILQRYMIKTTLKFNNFYRSYTRYIRYITRFNLYNNLLSWKLLNSMQNTDIGSNNNHVCLRWSRLIKA